MTTDLKEQKHGFQAEVKQLLKLVVNSLYSNKEIFLRELISNASDAIDKLRFLALSDNTLYGSDPNLQIKIEMDKDANTLTISDNGIGMSREEVIDNLGTIAKSGTREFLASLSGDQQKDASLIGQFGVGFYSAFIVADKVVVRTRRANADADQAVRWESNGEGEYTISNTEKPTRGTDIILHLKSEEKEFIESWRLRSIIRKYSDHITVPILMLKEHYGEEKEGEAPPTPELETVNRAQALWTLPKKDIKDEDLIEFYKHISHDFAEPLTWSLNAVEGAKLNYISLLYIPSQAPFDLGSRDQKHGLKLYVKRVFIMDDAEQFLPNYLRFVKGIVDSSDLPLNVSREILQSDSLIESMRSALTKRALTMLEKLSEDEEKYQKFWNAFGNALKEGPVEDMPNREAISKLLRFASTHTSNAAQTVSLDAYISRMSPEQEYIYYIIAENFNAAQHSPHLEIFREKKIEVLLLSERIDEWLMGYMTEYAGKKFQSIAKGDIDLSKLGVSDTPPSSPEEKNQLDKIVEQMKSTLGERVKDIRLSHRLTISPSCVVVESHEMSSHMQRILQAAGQPVPEVKPILELNPKHPLILRLCEEQDDARFADWSHLLLEQALLSESSSLQNSAEFVQRINKLLLAP